MPSSARAARCTVSAGSAVNGVEGLGSYRWWVLHGFSGLGWAGLGWDSGVQRDLVKRRGNGSGYHGYMNRIG
jgi:hypothetical protein